MRKVFPINFFFSQTPYDLANIFCSSMSKGKGSESLSEIFGAISRNLPRHQRSIEACWIVFGNYLLSRKLAMCTGMCCLVDKK